MIQLMEWEPVISGEGTTVNPLAMRMGYVIIDSCGQVGPMTNTRLGIFTRSVAAILALSMEQSVPSLIMLIFVLLK